MPLYEFLCKDCGHTYEDLVDYDMHGQCPHCNSMRVEKLASGFGGYNIQGNNSASERPKNAGYKSGRRKK